MQTMINDWMQTLMGRLQAAFGERLLFVGLQGSRARGEEHADSDIDAVVLLDRLELEDLQVYREIIRAMPDSRLACGFISGKEELLAWQRPELFQFYHDTAPVYGSLDFLLPLLTGEEVLRAVQAGACALYHGLCHAYLFGSPKDALPGLCKTAFFILPAIEYLRSGVYRRTKAELLGALIGDDRAVLELGMNTSPPPGGWEEACRLLLSWSRRVLKESGAALAECGRETCLNEHEK